MEASQLKLAKYHQMVVGVWPKIVPQGLGVLTQKYAPGAGGFDLICLGFLSKPPPCPGTGEVGVSID
jgi:hypothetical protein